MKDTCREACWICVEKYQYCVPMFHKTDHRAEDSLLVGPEVIKGKQYVDFYVEMTFR